MQIPKFTVYSRLDVPTIVTATKLKLPLIGGTALEMWANYYNIPTSCPRSENDIDFISDSDGKTAALVDWVRTVRQQTKRKYSVDVFQVRSHYFLKYAVYMGDVLVMNLPYLLWSKLIRFEERDIIDIKWILSISAISDEEISEVLEDLGVTDEEIERLNKIIKGEI